MFVDFDTYSSIELVIILVRSFFYFRSSFLICFCHSWVLVLATLFHLNSLFSYCSMFIVIFYFQPCWNKRCAAALPSLFDLAQCIHLQIFVSPQSSIDVSLSRCQYNNFYFAPWRSELFGNEHFKCNHFTLSFHFISTFRLCKRGLSF